jgi:hypothetical protein
MPLLDRWKRCVVNVEFRQPDGKIESSRSGTAIFIAYKDKPFLVTTFHLIKETETGSNKPIFKGLLFRVPLLSELKDDTKKKITTKNVYFDEKGRLCYQKTPNGIPYAHEGKEIAIPKFIPLSESVDPFDSAITISEKYDLVVISLRGRLSEICGKLFLKDLLFVEELLHLGYQPLTMEEIASEPSMEGADIFTVGYPNYISQVGKRCEMTERYEKYMSEDISLPCFTFGKVSMLSPHLPYFWGDLRVYPGNSGSPVIEDGKLIGIVSHEAVIENDEEFIKIPFAKVTKVDILPVMLEEQMKKDVVFADPKTLHKRFPGLFASPEEITKVTKET